MTTQTEGTGNGVRITAVRSIHTNGTIEPTGRELDVAISGPGYFNVGAADSPRYTRAGNFGLDSAGNLVTVGGDSVLGFIYDGGILGTDIAPINMLNFSTTATPTTTAAVQGNLDSSYAIGVPPVDPASFNALSDGVNYTASVDVIDSLGDTHDVILAFTKTAANTFTVQAYIDGGDVGGTVGVPSLLGSTDLVFNGTGLIDEANQAAAQLALTPAFGNGAAAGNVTIDLADFSQFAGKYGLAR
ncbi:MAG: flagellar hook-basal body complex protein [Oxalobacteraceae bacterium]|nr:flagellar hook-basal body complex protein [Oxalobacteraceae bacterium]